MPATNVPQLSYAASKPALDSFSFGLVQDLAETGVVVVGSPQTVRDQLAKLRDETRAGKLITMLQFGTLSDELTKRNMEMFASEVMPHLR